MTEGSGHMPEILVKLDEGAYLPERVHDTDAGADIRCRTSFEVAGHSSAVIRTGVHVQLPPGTVGMLKSKSGLNVRHNLVSEGVIDEGYTGEIVVKLYNNGEDTMRFEPGDKVTQLVVMPVLYPSYVETEAIEGGERGANGFGSTGK